uniref:N-acetyltransferase domain-containing protein n=1 Tax=Pinguiococcus pyrenoidosus TaxID=172671 RepID=A0A7R9UDH8_9STRA|mmetsp:Transcript_6644/g.25652  ORF Transcript_6644/g.25652 Transcript_6644/m.25652 type:complete len:137 (+) Transcript_6644:142-552(+)
MAEVSDVRHESPKFVLTLSLEDGSEGPEAFVEYEMDSGEDSGSKANAVGGAKALDTVQACRAESGSFLGIMDITHTFVPPEYRGKGVAGVLCQAAFEYCRENSLTVRPSCSYVSSRFVPKHPEFADIVEAAATEAA